MPPRRFVRLMPASQKAKRKEAAGESSGRDPSSSSLSLAFSEIEERSAKKYHTTCQIEKDVVHAAAKRALETKAKNGGRMPDKWYTQYLAEMRQTPTLKDLVVSQLKTMCKWMKQLVMPRCRQRRKPSTAYQLSPVTGERKNSAWTAFS